MFGFRSVVRSAIVCLSFAPVVFPVHAQALRPITFEDLDGVKTGESFVGTTLDISPDGKYVAVEHSFDLQVIDARTGHPLHALGSGIAPRFSPHGGRLAFYSNRSGEMQLWVWDMKSPEPRQVTSLRGGVDVDPKMRISGYLIDAFRFDWSPDGRKIVFTSRIAVDVPRAPGEPRVMDRRSPPDAAVTGIFVKPGATTGGVSMSNDGRTWEVRAPAPDTKLVSRLFVADVTTGKVEMLDEADGDYFHPDFAPDGTSIAAAVLPGNQPVYSAKEGEIRIIDLATGAMRVLAGGHGVKHRPAWSPSGQQLAFLVSDYYGAKPAIHIVDANDGSPVCDHPNKEGIGIWTLDWARGDDALVLSYFADGQYIGRMDARSPCGAVETVRKGAGPLWAQAGDGTLVWNETGPDGRETIKLGKGTEQPVTMLDIASTQGRDDRLRFGHIETIPYTTAHGFSLEGKLLYPAGYVEGKRYPLIVDAYPMNSGKSWMHPMGGNQAWATAGYMVFKPHQARAPHVTPNCAGDKDYCAAGKGPGGWDVMVDDVMSGVDELIRRGFVDADRMCVYGHSNGGAVVDYLITQTDRFRCAVVVSPVWSNWAGTPLLQGMWGILSNWSGVNPFDDPAAYTKLSAVFQVDNVKTPVLLAVGDKDGEFLLSAIEMYQALRFADKDVTFLRYPDQGHVFAGAALRDLWRREMDFFDKHMTRSQTPRETRMGASRRRPAAAEPYAPH